VHTFLLSFFIQVTPKAEGEKKEKKKVITCGPQRSSIHLIHYYLFGLVRTIFKPLKVMVSLKKVLIILCSLREKGDYLLL